MLDYQGKFDSILETVKDEICELKTKFYALVSEIHISKTVTYNLSKYIKTLEYIKKMRNIGDIWRYQAFLVLLTTMVWKKYTKPIFKS